MFRQFNEIQNHYRQELQKQWLKHYEEENAQKMKLKSAPLVPTTKLDATLQHLTHSLDELENVLSSILPNETQEQRAERIQREFTKKYSKLQQDYNKGIRSGSIGKNDMSLDEMLKRRLKIQLFLRKNPEISKENNDIVKEATEILDDPATTAEERELIMTTLKELKLGEIVNPREIVGNDVTKLIEDTTKRYGSVRTSPQALQDKIADEEMKQKILSARNYALKLLNRYGNVGSIPQNEMLKFEDMFNLDPKLYESIISGTYQDQLRDLANEMTPYQEDTRQQLSIEPSSRAERNLDNELQSESQFEEASVTPPPKTKQSEEVQVETITPQRATGPQAKKMKENTRLENNMRDGMIKLINLGLPEGARRQMQDQIDSAIGWLRQSTLTASNLIERKKPVANAENIIREMEKLSKIPKDQIASLIDVDLLHEDELPRKKSTDSKKEKPGNAAKSTKTSVVIRTPEEEEKDKKPKPSPKGKKGSGCLPQGIRKL